MRNSIYYTSVAICVSHEAGENLAFLPSSIELVSGCPFEKTKAFSGIVFKFSLEKTAISKAELAFALANIVRKAAFIAIVACVRQQSETSSLVVAPVARVAIAV